MLRLVMRRGPTPGNFYELTGETIMIGRGSKNDIVIQDNDVSREHCRLTKHGESYYLHDLGSSNGTFVNGMRVITQMPVQPGSLIELGDQITLFVEKIDAAEPHQHDTARAQPPPSLFDALPTQANPPPPDSTNYGLAVTIGPNTGRIYWLEDLLITIGRDFSNDIVLQDPEVSRRHARLRRFKQGYGIEDAGSTNSTFVNNEPLQGIYLLRKGDVVRLGTRVTLQHVQQREQSESMDDTMQNEVADPHAPAAPVLTRSLRYDSRTAQSSLIQAVPSGAGTGIEAGALRGHILLAYVREDWEAYVVPLTLTLNDAGLHVWVEQYLVPESEDWQLATEQAIDECWMLLIAGSAQAVASAQVRAQANAFWRREKPVILLLYNELLPLPDEMQRARIILHDEDNPNRTYQKIIFEMMQLRR